MRKKTQKYAKTTLQCKSNAAVPMQVSFIINNAIKTCYMEPRLYCSKIAM